MLSVFVCWLRVSWTRCFWSHVSRPECSRVRAELLDMHNLLLNMIPSYIGAAQAALCMKALCSYTAKVSVNIAVLNVRELHESNDYKANQIRVAPLHLHAGGLTGDLLNEVRYAQHADVVLFSEHTVLPIDM